MINMKDEKLAERLQARLKYVGGYPKFIDGKLVYCFPPEAQPAIRYKRKPIGKVHYVSPDGMVSMEMYENNGMSLMFNQKYREFITIN